MLQSVAVCCSVLQCVAVCCSVLQWRNYAAPKSGVSFVTVPVFQCAVVCYSVLQSVAVCCSVLKYAAVCYNVLQSVRVCSSKVVCCSVLQYAAVCCSVMQCVQWFTNAAPKSGVSFVTVHRLLVREVRAVVLTSAHLCVLQRVAVCCSVLQRVAA